jgi:hypothetical protein
LVLLRRPDGQVLGEGRADSIDDAYTIALADLLTKSGEPPDSLPPADAAQPAEPVVLPLDAPAVRRLARYLTVVRNHLRHGAPMPPYEAFDFRDNRIRSVMWEIRDQLGLVQPYHKGPPNPYRGAMSEPVALTLRLAPATARAVEMALYAFGEHYAAGAPVEGADDEAEARVESVLAELVDSGLTTE